MRRIILGWFARKHNIVNKVSCVYGYLPANKEGTVRQIIPEGRTMTYIYFGGYTTIHPTSVGEPGVYVQIANEDTKIALIVLDYMLDTHFNIENIYMRYLLFPKHADLFFNYTSRKGYFLWYVIGLVGKTRNFNKFISEINEYEEFARLGKNIKELTSGIDRGFLYIKEKIM